MATKKTTAKSGDQPAKTVTPGTGKDTPVGPTPPEVEPIEEKLSLVERYRLFIDKYVKKVERMQSFTTREFANEARALLAEKE